MSIVSQSDLDSFYEEFPETNSVYSDTSSTRSNKKKENKLKHPTVHTIKRWTTREVQQKGETKTERYRKKIHLFETPNTLNHPIINASTGYTYMHTNPDYRVGSRHQDDLFSMKFITHEDKCPSYLLFYDNPEQCERHLCFTLDTSIKEAWNEKYTRYQRTRVNRQ